MKRAVKVLLVVFIMVGLAVPLFGCGSAAEEADGVESQVIAVERGDLVIDISASGNLGLSYLEELAFEVAGTVVEVSVEEGDSVKEGQMLAKLDTTEWDKQIKALEKKLIEADRQVAAKEFAVLQAQLDVRTAEYNLGQIDEVKDAQDAVDNAKLDLEIILKVQLGTYGGGLLTDFSYWSQLEANARQQITQSQEDLQDILDGSSIQLSSDVALQVAKSQLQVEQSRIKLEDAETAVDDAKQVVEDAQSDFDEARSLSPIIKAPFDGFITKINASGGDEVLKGTVAMDIADPNKFEAYILVNEMDISQVQIGADAQVQVDSLSGLTIPAEVTYIAPRATIQSGVVNYRVKVELKSLESIQQERQETRQGASADMAAGELPERLKQAIEEGRITPEQADAIRQRIQEGGGLPGGGLTGGGPPGGQPGAQPAQRPAVTPSDFQLREGLTVTVAIVFQQKQGVLLVPNKAIKSQDGVTYVEVWQDGASQQRAVKTGISNWQSTEVIEGLSEGEEIVIPGSATSATTQSSSSGGFVPGMGRMLR
ncbi:MAG: HlyD family efflux transporter periplasmic adaptor subunit [Chloroflexota bacterium]